MTTPERPSGPGYKSTEDYVDPGEEINAMFEEGFGDMREREVPPEWILMAQGITPDSTEPIEAEDEE